MGKPRRDHPPGFPVKIEIVDVAPYKHAIEFEIDGKKLTPVHRSPFAGY